MKIFLPSAKYDRIPRTSIHLMNSRKAMGSQQCLGDNSYNPKGVPSRSTLNSSNFILVHSAEYAMFFKYHLHHIIHINRKDTRYRYMKLSRRSHTLFFSSFHFCFSSNTFYFALTVQQLNNGVIF